MADFITYEYDNQVIEFFMTDDLLVNATEMAAVFRKRPVDFLALKSTKELIEAMKKRPIGDKKGEESSPLNAGKALFDVQNATLSENGVPILITIPGREHGGTWMHRWLALDFAMWLDVDFKLWLLERIDYLFVAAAQNTRKLVVREMELANERNRLLEKNKDDPEFQKLYDVVEELHGLRNKKSEQARKTYRGWKKR